MSALLVVMLLSTALLGVGWGGGDDRSERAVKWWVEPPVGLNWVRARAVIEACIHDQPLVEAPIIEYEGNRVYIELRHSPENLGGCALNLPIASKKITFGRDLDELVLFDASTDPPERRWPTEHYSANG